MEKKINNGLFSDGFVYDKDLNINPAYKDHVLPYDSDLTTERLKDFLMDVFINRAKPEKELVIYQFDDEEGTQLKKFHRMMKDSWRDMLDRQQEEKKKRLGDNYKWVERRMKKRKYVKKALEAALRLDREKNKPIIET
jgi:hypothetical protein